MSVCQLDVAYAVLYDVWSKSVKHQFLAPIGVRHLTTGAWLIGILRAIVVFALLSAVAWWSFGFDALHAGVAPLAIFLLGCCLTAWSVSVGVCTLIMLFGAKAETAAWASVNFVLTLAGICGFALTPCLSKPGRLMVAVVLAAAIGSDAWVNRTWLISRPEQTRAQIIETQTVREAWMPDLWSGFQQADRRRPSRKGAAH